MPPPNEKPGRANDRESKSFADQNERFDDKRNAPEFQPKSPQIPVERLRHLARSIHQLGERPLLELFKELDCGADLPDALERYGRLASLAGFIAAQGGDQLPVVRLVGAAR
jgi:hypothetical protein